MVGLSRLCSFLCDVLITRRTCSRTCSRSGRTLQVCLSSSPNTQRNYEQVRLVHLIVIAFPVPQILEQSVDVIEVILQEQCQRMRFFLLRSCGEGPHASVGVF